MKPVAIVGGSRIPFCRAFTGYMEKTNQDMLTASLQGLVDKYELHGEKIDDVQGGAVIKHSRDWNLARESVLSTTLSPDTPATTMQIACGTSLQAAIDIAAKIGAGHIESGIACGVDSISDSPLVFGPKFQKRMIKLSRERSMGGKLKTFGKGFSFGELKPMTPNAGEPRTGLSMGQHMEITAQEWGVSREDQDALAARSHQNATKAYAEGFHDDLVVPFAGVTQDNNVRDDSTVEGLAKLKSAFDRTENGTMTAGNSTPLTDGGAAVLLASEKWARERGLPILGYLTNGRTAAVDFVKGEGLLMAPTIAMSEMLKTANRTLQDFDLYEIHEAFASQVLATLKAWEDGEYCEKRLGRKRAMGSINMDQLNPTGSSVAYGHPFAATGARILASTAKQLEQSRSNSAVISVCTAGGMGVTAIIER